MKIREFLTDILELFFWSEYKFFLSNFTISSLSWIISRKKEIILRKRKKKGQYYSGNTRDNDKIAQTAQYQNLMSKILLIG